MPEVTEVIVQVDEEPEKNKKKRCGSWGSGFVAKKGGNSQGGEVFSSDAWCFCK